jgi:arylsulfatase A-like enzyme
MTRLSAALAAVLAAAPLHAAPPNVLFVLSDDQRFDTVAALGNPDVKTPHLDALARDGFAFTRAHIMGGNQPAVCVPSRAMLLTGRTLFHISNDLSADHVTMPQAFTKAGYVSFGVGKWHNGPASFNRSFADGAALFFGGMNDHRKVPLADYDPAGKYDPRDRKVGDGFSTDLFADAAVRFLKTHKGDKPFFLYVAFTAPHDPRTPPPEYAKLYDPAKLPLPKSFLPRHPFDNGELEVRDEKLAPWPRTPEVVRRHLADYYGMISHLDAQVGRIRAALRETGRDRDTLIVFAGDNGLALGRHGLMGKQSLYDHSVRVPLLLAGPGVPRGKSDALCYLLDVFPTLCELTGTATPATVEGKSLKPVLDGKQAQVRDRLFGAYRDVQRMIDDGRWKLIRYPKVDRTQLFDLAADPDEVNDLSADPKHAAKVKELLALLAAEQKRLGDPAAREGPPRHERLPKEEPRGRREKVSLGTLFLPEGLDAGRPVPLFVHFHGPAWLPEVAASRLQVAVLSVHLGQGSAAYARPFAARGAFLDLLKEAEARAGVRFGEVGLTAWSAGYGAVRAVLQDQAAYERVAFVVLIDGMHAGYADGRGKAVVPEHVEAFVRFAADAAAGKKRMVVTHSEIVPGRYASTTETADHLLGRLGLKRVSAAREGPMKLRQRSEARKGRLTLVGYAGDTAADHVDQLHALPDFLRWARWTGGRPDAARAVAP